MRKEDQKRLYNLCEEIFKLEVDLNQVRKELEIKDTECYKVWNVKEPLTGCNVHVVRLNHRKHMFIKMEILIGIDMKMGLSVVSVI
jgi:hypothetical protein